MSTRKQASQQEKREVNPDTLAELIAKAENPFTPGQAVMIITVTLYYIGLVLKVTDQEIVLGNMGVFTEVDNITLTLAGRKNPQVEMAPDDGIGLVSRGAIIAAFPWYPQIPAPAGL